MSEQLKCPKCTDEELAKVIGNILVCPNCDIVLIDTRKTVDWFEEVDKPKR